MCGRRRRPQMEEAHRKAGPCPHLFPFIHACLPACCPAEATTGGTATGEVQGFEEKRVTGELRRRNPAVSPPAGPGWLPACSTHACQPALAAGAASQPSSQSNCLHVCLSPCLFFFLAGVPETGAESPRVATTKVLKPQVGPCCSPAAALLPLPPQRKTHPPATRCLPSDACARAIAREQLL